MEALAGTMWRLIEVTARDDAGREVPSPIGQHPMGFVMFKDDRILVAVTDPRPSLAQEAQPRPLISYTGKYRFDGTELVTETDAASRPDLMMEQVREMRFESATRLVMNYRRQAAHAALATVLVAGDRACSSPKIRWPMFHNTQAAA